MTRVHRRSRSIESIALLIVFTCIGVVALGLTDVPTLASSDPVIVAAGDIVCDPGDPTFNGGVGTATECRQMATYNLITQINPVAVLPLGDLQHYCGGYQAYVQAYELSWGRAKSISYPIPGNHEYLTTPGTEGWGTGCDDTNTGAAGYFRYWGARAGDPTKGYYSYDIGAWHIVALNSQCSQSGGCGTGSPQELWLRADLAAHPNLCILTYWHIPLWSSGGRANANSAAFMRDLYNYGGDLVLSGHDHLYERFAPQDPNGNLDLERGVRQFIAGTGGQNHTSFVTTAPNRDAGNDHTFGVLKLTLHSTSYDWEFVPETGQSFTDAGSANCHNTRGAAPAPTTSDVRAVVRGQIESKHP